MNCATGDANPGMTTTPRCSLALKHAEQNLSPFNHSHLTSAHLILGLMMLRNGIPFNVLTQSGLSIETVEGYLSSLRLAPEDTTKRDNVPWGKSGRMALERGEADARSRHHTYLGTDHLFLGILAEETGEAADLFAAVHIDREKLRNIVMHELS